MLPPRVRRVVEVLLTQTGRLDAAIRRAIAARTASLGGGAASIEGGGDVPAALAVWVDKIARHAYRSTDEDVAAMAQAGYSEDQIFEATLAAALGAGVARFERGLAVLREARR